MTALVTGASAGFDRAICRRLAGGGHDNTTPLTEQDVAEAVAWICKLPQHVDINTIEMMPVVQSFGALPVARRTTDAR